ncbi:MgtC/SapB family protein [Sideroxydans lithotrophicus]|uniref:Protein MgtC n=1 Tax=Sideroxydans lithotrophicus (strain ES-1) TaxID=580332 RepID=D5CNG4_SIDLE|nr:MgtC/SapB family protein [Sideroxydans lithotrophicus]ADE10877.1 MgtC/SapB transporter [Sideroxydans lithotrophicus ES-1]
MGEGSFLNLSAYWSAPEVATNLIVFFNLLGALILGLIVGYERSYHGRAAGMRTYGLVCMAAAALTVIAGYPAYWFGGQANTYLAGDPTRVIQGIVTGIGFLGAGVIMRDGLNISGLTTAASIWTCSAIGIMVGVGFYASAIMLTLLSALIMMWISKLENWLPSRPAIAVTLEFQKNFVPLEHTLREVVYSHGYEIASGSFAIRSSNEKLEWHFVAVALSKNSGAAMNELASGLSTLQGVEDFSLAHARN